MKQGKSAYMSNEKLKRKMDMLHRSMDEALDEDDAEIECSILEDSLSDLQNEGGNRSSRMTAAVTARMSVNNKEDVNMTLEDFFGYKQEPDYDAMTELERYMEVQRRRKLLYGVKDVRKLMIEQMDDESKEFYKRDVCCEPDHRNEGSLEASDNKLRGKREWSIRDFLKPEKFIISMNS